MIDTKATQHAPTLQPTYEELLRRVEELEQLLATNQAEQKPKVEDEKGGFGGFVAPVSNYFRMPNNWTDISAKIKSLAELKLIEYVLRHTWGFQEYEGELKKITIDEFMHGRKRKGGGGGRLDDGTSLSNRSVIDGLRRAVEHGYLICQVDDSDKARTEKYYALNMKAFNPSAKKPNTESRCEESSQQTCRIFTADMKDLHSGSLESSQRSEKETPERNSRKTPKKESASVEPTNPSSNGTLSSSQSFSSNVPSEVELSTEEQQIYGLWCGMPFNLIPPKITETLKKRCAELVPHIHTLEEMASLVAFARQHRKLKTIALGNLVACLNDWRQTQLPPDKQPPPAKTTVGNRYRQPFSSQPRL